jgi:hypothetical protein
MAALRIALGLMLSAVMDFKNVLNPATTATQPMMATVAVQHARAREAAATPWYKLFLKLVMTVTPMLAVAVTLIVQPPVRVQLVVIQIIAPKQSFAMTVPTIAAAAVMLIAVRPV